MSIDSLPAPATRPGRTVYETYLRTDELLSLQKPPEQRLHPDELTFQVVHQTFELWWKITVEHLLLATTCLQAGPAGRGGSPVAAGRIRAECRDGGTAPA